jgi:hypothetical protein
MRKQPEWWAKWDDRILEFLYENGPASSGIISSDEYIRISQPYVSRRLRTLREHNLIEATDNNAYVITKRGRYYLAGGYDPQTQSYLHETDPDRGIYNYERMGIYMRDLADKFRHNNG